MVEGLPGNLIQGFCLLQLSVDEVHCVVDILCFCLILGGYAVKLCFRQFRQLVLQIRHCVCAAQGFLVPFLVSFDLLFQCAVRDIFYGEAAFCYKVFVVI